MFLRRQTLLVVDPVALHPTVQPRFLCEADHSMFALMFPIDASAGCDGEIPTLPFEMLEAARRTLLPMILSPIGYA